MRTMLLLCLALAGCDDLKPAPPPEWRCIGGLTYKHIDTAWVLLDGHSYIGFRDGPIKCAEPPAQGKEVGR